MAYSSEYYKAYYQKNKERKKATNKEWEKKNRERLKEYNRLKAKRLRKENPERFKMASKKWEENNPEKILLKAARNRAKLKGLDFDIDLEDIVIPTHCPLLNIELVRKKCGQGPKDCSPSLDRIDNTKGYVKNNVWVISAMANRIKTNATNDQIILLARNLEKIFGNNLPTVRKLMGKEPLNEEAGKDKKGDA
jgi:hypothetical protein